MVGCMNGRLHQCSIASRDVRYRSHFAIIWEILESNHEVTAALSQFASASINQRSNVNQPTSVSEYW